MPNLTPGETVFVKHNDRILVAFVTAANDDNVVICDYMYHYGEPSNLAAKLVDVYLARDIVADLDILSTDNLAMVNAICEKYGFGNEAFIYAVNRLKSLNQMYGCDLTKPLR